MNFETDEQQYSSRNTEQNKTKAPQLFHKAKFKPNTTCLDYGGGAFDTAVFFLRDINVEAMVYDKYNRSKEHNEAVREWVEKNNGVDYVSCSNVLNVIYEEHIQRQVVKNIYEALKHNGTAYFVTYEGDRSGIGRQTKKDCWQHNKRTKEYLSLIREFFPSAKINGFLITAIKE